MSRIERFTYFERVVHWALGLSFVYLLFTGLAFSHPRLFWITVLSGGGQTARFLHPWIGVLFSVSLGSMFFIWAKDMRLEGDDRAWMKAIRAYATRQKDGVPPAGKRVARIAQDAPLRFSGVPEPQWQRRRMQPLPTEHVHISGHPVGVRHRRVWKRTARHLRGVTAALSMHVIQPLGPRVVGLQRLVVDRPGGRYTVHVLDRFEVFAA